MSYLKKRAQVDVLQQRINAFGTLNPEVKKKIDYKFRLDWNYYSNNIEGNTLTLEETRSIMVGNIVVNNKSIKEILELKGHDKVITDILKMGKGEIRLSEKRIKEIHKSIMHEEDEEKQSKIGKWKTEPNYIYNYKNERFDFTHPSDVHDEMHKLINQTNTNIDHIIAGRKNAPHPIDLALTFHLKYVTIHPLYAMQSAKLIVKGIFIENIFLNPAPKTPAVRGGLKKKRNTDMIHIRKA